MERFKSADDFIKGNPEWALILQKLREIVLSTGLVETIKWGLPVYTYQGKNILGLGAFKSYAGLWFFQGALLVDEENALMNAQEGITRALRQWRFANPEEIKPELIKSYIFEAIQNQKEGKEIKPERKSLKIPEELMDALKSDPALKSCFVAFSKFRQREFAEYVSEAKKPETRQNRLGKIIPMIRAQHGLNDKYRG
ncbi:MAG: YdeI/OmpD-associated family protein [Bacteroidales bacterium]|nr:YdeI/OmpD-associated family protein [Bacteroidales bacterium]MCF8404510.1 YdeI/OmpD-associated family protein [Bacteroidales bacterium]